MGRISWRFMRRLYVRIILLLPITWILYKLVEIMYIALAIKLFHWNNLILPSDMLLEEHQHRSQQAAGSSQHDASSKPPRSTIIPKRVIQLITGSFPNASSLPSHWQTARSECEARLSRAGITLELWHESDCYQLLQQHYPSWLQFVQAREKAVERADMCRYFVLYHHGGIYIDCDLVCKRSFASLLNIKGALLPATDIGLSNDLIVAPPKHHLLELAAFSLHAWSDYKLLPYPTTLFSCGPGYASLMARRAALSLDECLKTRPEEQCAVYVLPKALYSEKQPSAFVKHVQGVHWQSWDAALLKGINNYPMRSVLLAVLFFVLLHWSRRKWKQQQLCHGGGAPAT